MTLLFCHPRRLVAGIHQEKFTDGCPIKAVGHDDEGEDARYKTSGMTMRKGYPIHTVGNNRGEDARYRWFKTNLIEGIYLYVLYLSVKNEYDWTFCEGFGN